MIWRYALTGLIFGLSVIAVKLVMGNEETYRIGFAGAVLPLLGCILVGVIIGWVNYRSARKANPPSPRNRP